MTSVTTSVTPFGNVTYEVDYSFADGTGLTQFESHSGELASVGEVFFTSPVSNVEFSFSGSGFEVGDNVGDTLFLNCCRGVQTDSATFAGSGITLIEWQTGDIEAGITSLSYTVPEPSSLLLSGMGLAALIGLARRNRTKGQKATV